YLDTPTGHPPSYSLSVRLQHRPRRDCHERRRRAHGHVALTAHLACLLEIPRRSPEFLARGHLPFAPHRHQQLTRLLSCEYRGIHTFRDVLCEVIRCRFAASRSRRANIDHLRPCELVPLLAKLVVRDPTGDRREMDVHVSAMPVLRRPWRDLVRHRVRPPPAAGARDLRQSPPPGCDRFPIHDD